MDRTSFRAQLMVGVLAAATTMIATSLTGAGETGFYAFAILSLTVGILWMGWPEVRASRDLQRRRWAAFKTRLRVMWSRVARGPKSHT